jgi:beta-lactamase superfamily II metal-dependent hydrolase
MSKKAYGLSDKAAHRRTGSDSSGILKSPLAKVMILVILLGLSGLCAYNIAFSSVSGRMGVDIVCLPSEGSCSVVRSGKGTVIIDAGTEDDAALLLDYLHENNIRAVDAMIITSDDPLCCSGAVEIIENVMVDQLVIPDLGDYPSNAWGRVESAALKEGISPTVIPEDSAFILQKTSFLLLPVNRDGLPPVKKDTAGASTPDGEAVSTDAPSSADASLPEEASLPENASSSLPEDPSLSTGAPLQAGESSSTGAPLQVDASFSAETPLSAESGTEGGADHDNSDHVHVDDSEHVHVDDPDHVHVDDADHVHVNNPEETVSSDGVTIAEDTTSAIPPSPCCLFVSVMYGSGTALFTGNAPDKAVTSYLSGELGGRHDVIMLPQNGKMFNSLNDLLSASAPSGVIIPCPSAASVETSVSDLISAARAKRYLTCDGEIHISSSGKKMRIRQ